MDKLYELSINDLGEYQGVAIWIEVKLVRLSEFGKSVIWIKILGSIIINVLLRNI